MTRVQPRRRKPLSRALQVLPFEPLESRALLATVVDSVGDLSPQMPPAQIGVTQGAGAIAIVATNTAPTLVGANHLNAIYEDNATQPGTRVAALVEGFIIDPDGPASGIAVTNAIATYGNWQFATDGVTWQPLGAVSATAACLLAADADTRIRFVPNADYNGTVIDALTFRAWDGFNGGVEGVLANTTVNGDATAYSTATASSSIIVYGVADGPRFITAQTTLSINTDAPAQSIAGFVTSFTPGSTNPVITGNGYAPSINVPGLSVDVVDVATIPQSIDPNTGTLKPARTNFSYFAPGDASRLFVNDMRGKLWIIQNSTLLSAPFLDIPAVRGDNWIDNSSSINSERGFSTFAFHPDFNDTTKPGYHKVYTVHTEAPASAARGDFDSPSGVTAHYDVLSEWTVDASNPNVIATTSRREILRLAQPLVDHNMNQVAFNPTSTPGDSDFGKLYIGVGDGGNTGNVRPLNIVDQYNDGQNRQVPFGKILRIDPLGSNAANGKYGIPTDNPFVAAHDPGDTALDEIWAIGLRNPQRFSWDTVTGKMLISDIGQKNAEEINLGIAGANYGWSEREGMFAVDHTSGNQTKVYGLPANDASLGYTYPVATYDRSEGIAIVGGFVYRGSAMPYLQGKYIFGDLNTGKVYFADVNDLALGTQANIQELTLFSGGTQKTLLQILGGGATRTDMRFGLDANGEIYLTTKFDGKVRKLAARTQSASWTPPAALPIVSGVPNLTDSSATYRVANLSNASLFAVGPSVAANGTLTFTPAPNALGTATFTLTAEDTGGTAFGRVNTSAQQIITINIVALNHAPTNIALSATSAVENASVGNAVGTLSTTDVDSGDTFTYTLVAGTGDADNAAFSIVGNSLKTAAVFDYETKNSYSIRVRSTDANGLTTEKQFTISVTNVNETPTDIALSTTSVPENTAKGTIVGLLSSSDTDAGESFTYSLVAGAGSTDNAFFAIDGGLLKAAASFNYEAKNSYSIRVCSTDAGGLTSERQFTGSVLDLPEPITPPVATVPSVFSVVEDQATGLIFTGTPFTDADSPATRVMTVTLKVANGTISALSADGVAVGGTAIARRFTGTLTSLNAFFTDSPARITYTTVANSTKPVVLATTISEPSGLKTLSSSVTSTVAVTAVDDAPTLTVPGSFTVKEDIRGNLAWTAQKMPFTDIDSSSLTVTLAVQDGAISAASTAAVAVGGTATARSFTGTTAALNAYFRKLGSIGYTSAPNSTVARTLTTTVSDGILSASKVSTIKITPVNDAPTVYAVATLTGGRPGIPYEITYESLRTAANVADVETTSPGILIQAINSGSLQKWNGTAWAAVSVAANAPLSQKLISAGQKIRWLPPAGAIGNQPAFKIKASDGALTSAMTAQVFVSLE